MSRFIINIALFSLGILLYFAANAGINAVIIKYAKAPVDKTQILILGDSHPEKSLNPALFSDAINISQPGEPYIISFWKLKKILKTVIPDTVIIGFAPHNISAYNDRKFSDETWSSEMFKRIYAIQNFKSLSGIDIDYQQFYKVLWREICVYPKLNHASYIGGYSNSDNSNLTDVQTVIEKHYYYKHKKLGVSELSVSYLDSLINICDKHNITPILVSSPVHESYYRKIPTEIISAYRNIGQKYSSRGVRLIDKTTDYYPDSLYYNVDHLNENGAVILTGEIIGLLKNSIQSPE